MIYFGWGLLGFNSSLAVWSIARIIMGDPSALVTLFINLIGVAASVYIILTARKTKRLRKQYRDIVWGPLDRG